MSTAKNLAEMEQIALGLMKSPGPPTVKVQVGRLLELFGEETQKFVKVTQGLSDELAELEALRGFVKSQGLRDNFESYRKLGSKRV